jgi:cytochrome c peroxidase
MRRKPILVLAAVAAIVLAGFAVAVLSRPDAPATAAFVDTSHGDVKLPKGEMPRVLNAINATTDQVANDQLVAEGRKIFRDQSLFENGETCQTCHAEGTASARLGTMVHDAALKTQNPPKDPAFPDPPKDFDGPRDPPSLTDLDNTPPYFWAGNVKTIDEAVATPVFGHMKAFVPGGQTGSAVPGVDCEGPDTSVGHRDPRCDKEAGRLAAALIAYIRTLKPPQSSFDDGTMSTQALAGEKIFQGKGGCIECHGGPDFTDNLVHNTGVPQVKFTSPYGTTPATRPSNDLGAPAPPAAAECAGANAAACDPAPPQTSAFINTPQMRDLNADGPFMHNGVFKSLEQVVGFYNGKYLASDPPPPDAIPTPLANDPNPKVPKSTLAPLNLTDAEMRDLVAYLKSL